MSETKPTLEGEARELNDALYAILYWDQNNVIPDDLARRGSDALRSQFAPATVNVDLLEVLERALKHSNCPGENCAIDWHAQAQIVISKAKGEQS